MTRLIGYDCSSRDNQRYAHREGHVSDLYDYRYPLREWGWDRDDCDACIADAGLPLFPKSSCFFCTSMKISEVRALPREELRLIVLMEARAAAARIWLAEREADLLPVGYFHVVFTLPAEVADIALQNKAAVYGLLFQAASETMTTIAADPKHLGARIGITAVLHTWGSAMTHHPHIHMIVPGGGLSPDGSRWVSSRPAFLLPVRVLGKLFRRLFLTRMIALHEAGRLAFYGSLAHLADRRMFLRHLSPVRKKRWVVYAKPPFAGPETVLAYLSRYTHRVIENAFCRLKDFRRVATRYDKLATNFLSGVAIATALAFWL